MPEHAPEATLAEFRRALFYEDLRQAYDLLCSESRAAYSFERWRLFISKTKLGADSEEMFLDWHLAEVRFSDDRQEASVLLANPANPAERRQLDMVREGGQWKLRCRFP